MFAIRSPSMYGHGSWPNAAVFIALTADLGVVRVCMVSSLECYYAGTVLLSVVRAADEQNSSVEWYVGWTPRQELFPLLIHFFCFSSRLFQSHLHFQAMDHSTSLCPIFSTFAQRLQLPRISPKTKSSDIRRRKKSFNSSLTKHVPFQFRSKNKHISLTQHHPPTFPPSRNQHTLQPPHRPAPPTNPPLLLLVLPLPVTPYPPSHNLPPPLPQIPHTHRPRKRPQIRFQQHLFALQFIAPGRAEH